MRELEPNHGFVTALADLLAHDVAQRFVRILVDGDFGVAGQPEQRGSGELHAVIKLMYVAANHLIQWNKHLLPGRRVRRQRDPLFQHARYFHARVGGCLFRRVVKRKGQRDGEVREKRKGVRRIENQRRESRGDLGIEIALRFLALGGRQPIPLPEVDSVSCELRQEVFPETVGLAIEARHKPAMNSRKQRCLFRRGLFPQDRDPLHEELVQI